MFGRVFNQTVSWREHTGASGLGEKWAAPVDVRVRVQELKMVYRQDTSGLVRGRVVVLVTDLVVGGEDLFMVDSVWYRVSEIRSLLWEPWGRGEKNLFQVTATEWAGQ